MAKTVVINGIVYQDSPGIDIPQQDGGGMARFVETSDANATAADIRPGKSGYVNGEKIPGAMAEKSAATYNVSGSDQTISANQFLTGAQTIRGVTTSGITAANIKAGVVVKVGDAADDDRIVSVTGTLSQPTISQDSSGIITIS